MIRGAASSTLEQKAGLNEACRLVFEHRGTAIEARPDAVAQESPRLKNESSPGGHAAISTRQIEKNPTAASAVVVHGPPGEDGTHIKGSDKKSLESFADNKGLSEHSELRAGHSK